MKTTPGRLSSQMLAFVTSLSLVRRGRDRTWSFVGIGGVGSGVWYGLAGANEAVVATPASLSSLNLELDRRADRNNWRVEEGGTLGGVSVGLGPAPSSAEFGDARGGPKWVLWCWMWNRGTGRVNDLSGDGWDEVQRGVKL